jgi:putative spermidine/putrescine transport system permease protein
MSGARLRAILLYGITALLMVLILLPLLIVIAVSVSDSVLAQFPPSGFTLKWYAAVLGDDEFLASLRFSTLLATAAMLLSLALGIPASFVLARGRFFGRALLTELLLSPLIFPALVIGLALLELFSALHWSDARLTLVIAHGVITVPYILRTVTASLLSVNPSLEEAARTLGATRLQVFRRVVLPQIASGIAAGAIFAFMVSFDDYPVAMWLANSLYQPVSLLLFSRIGTVFDPSVAAMSTLMILVAMVIVAVMEKIIGIRRAMTM